jgi:hypothetical protein
MINETLQEEFCGEGYSFKSEPTLMKVMSNLHMSYVTLKRNPAHLELDERLVHWRYRFCQRVVDAIDTG